MLSWFGVGTVVSLSHCEIVSCVTPSKLHHSTRDRSTGLSSISLDKMHAKALGSSKCGFFMILLLPVVVNWPAECGLYNIGENRHNVYNFITVLFQIDRFC